MDIMKSIGLGNADFMSVRSLFGWMGVHATCKWIFEDGGQVFGVDEMY